MGKIKVYPPVKIFAAVTYQQDIDIPQVYNKIKEILSSIDLISDEYDFSLFTDYYSAEMGENLKKHFIAFKELKQAEILPDLKIASNSIEEQFCENDNRSVNIDPGYVCHAKIVLASSKDFAHRIYLNRGIFGDVHLYYRAGKFHPNEWTYPDYKQPEILKFFEQLRKQYLNLLKELKLD